MEDDEVAYIIGRFSARELERFIGNGGVQPQAVLCGSATFDSHLKKHAKRPKKYQAIAWNGKAGARNRGNRAGAA